jgi:hypothetical protein
MVTLVILVEALSDCGETEVKLQFHPQTKDNQKLAESETVKLKIDIIIERNFRNYHFS